MSPIDERLKSLNIVRPDVMPPVVVGYAPAFAPFTRSGDQIHISSNLQMTVPVMQPFVSIPFTR
jgi:hypothetical protein